MFGSFRDLAFMGAAGRRLLYPAYVQDYLDRVTAADIAAGNTSGLELGVTDAVNDYIVDLVSDTYLGVSGNVIAQEASVIKASCIMAGARTRLGAMVPLVGAAPTSFNFVDGDYNRKTGLVGDGSTKYLNSNHNCNADPQNSHHAAAYATDVGTTGYAMGAGATGPGATNVGCPTLVFRNRATVAYQPSSPAILTGLVGVSRSNAADYVIRRNASNVTFADVSSTPVNQNIGIFTRNGTVFQAGTNARLAFYSIGEALDLALLDARVTDLINAFGAAIP
jgi:hypothetical protein